MERIRGKQAGKDFEDIKGGYLGPLSRLLVNLKRERPIYHVFSHHTYRASKASVRRSFEQYRSSKNLLFL
jgi:hypothetical protein